MTEQIRQYHLQGRGMSGRGVRLRTLSYDAVQKLEQDALVGMKEGTTINEWRAQVRRDGVIAMIVELTDPNQSDAVAATYKKVPAIELTGHLGDFFTTRDMAFLTRVYVMEHEIDEKEVDLLAGKSLLVTTGA